MNRRQLLLTSFAALIPVSAKAELKVIGHRLERKKRFEISHGSVGTQVYAVDSLHIQLSDGSKAECWIDPSNVLNTGGIKFDDLDSVTKRGDVAEAFAKQYFGMKHA
jgi:hypothetical protein